MISGPADELASAEQRWNRLTSPDAQKRTQDQLQEYLTESKASQEELARLEAREIELTSLLQTQRLQAQLREEGSEEERRSTMAEALDELTDRLSRHGVRMLAMEPSDSGGGRSHRLQATQRAAARKDREKAAKQPDWHMIVLATWPAVKAALTDPSVFPAGLALAALKMEPAKPRTTFRRWELVVSEGGSKP